jgi:hypothetical protein
MKNWFDYVKVGYDLIVEAEDKSRVILEHDVEAYIVHMFARNLERTDIGEIPIAIQLMEAMGNSNREVMSQVGDECLLINSFPFKRKRWPSVSYYVDMGTISYGFAGNRHLSEEVNFRLASTVLNWMFQQNRG